MTDPLASLRRRLIAATHRLDAAPPGLPWNLREHRDLLPEAGALRAAAVLVPIVPRAGAAQVILTRRTERLRHHAGQISFPGGRLEEDDLSPLEAALREMWEEVGIEAAAVDPLGYLDPFATITGFRVTPVVGLVQPPRTLRLDPNEVAEAFEVPLQFLLEPGNCATRAREYRGRLRRYHVYHWQQHEIWGATASILYNLAQRWHAVRA
jgi:8-oxo-dGTP pyrophosphatase MutT (NUDIX family)